MYRGGLVPRIVGVRDTTDSVDSLLRCVVSFSFVYLRYTEAIRSLGRRVAGRDHIRFTAKAAIRVVEYNWDCTECRIR